MAEQVTNRPVASNIPPLRGSGSKLLVFGGKADPGGHEVSLEKQVLVKRQPFLPNHDIPLEEGEEVELRGSGLDIYERVGFASTENGFSFEVAYKDLLSGDGLLRFKVPDLANWVKDGGGFWLKLLAKDDFRSANITIGPHAIYFIDEPEDKKDGKQAGAGKNRAAAARMAQAAPGAFILGAMGDTLDGIAGALKSTTQVSSAGGQTLSQGARVSAASAKPVASGATTNIASNIDYDDEIHTQVEASGGEVAASAVQKSTAEVSTVGQTISQSGTISSVSQGGQLASSATVRAGGGTTVDGTVSQTQTTQVSSGGTIRAEGSATASGRVEGTAQQTGAQASAGGTVSGTSQSSGQFSAAGGTAAGASTTQQVEGQSKISATGQSETAVEGKTTPVTSQPQQASASVKAQAGQEIKVGGQIQSDVASALFTQPPIAQPTTPKPPEPAPSQAGKGRIDGINSGTTRAVQEAPSVESIKIQPAGGAAGLKVLSSTVKASTGLDSAGIKPPVGLKGIFQNRQNLDSKLTLRQHGGGAGSVGARGVMEGAIAGQAVPKAEGGAYEGQNEKNTEQENIEADPENREDALPETLQQNSGPEEQHEQDPSQQQNSNLQDKAEPEEQESGDEDSGQEQKEQQRQPFQKPQAVESVATTAAAGLAGEVAGQATSQLWWWGFGISSATFFTGLDFMAGAVIMDIYWWSSRKQPKIFPMKLWQKIVTVFANVLPPVIIMLFLYIVMVVGCNYPSNAITYRTTILGLLIGDDCKYFDISHVISNSGAGSSTLGGGGSSGGGGASSSFGPVPATSGTSAVTPRGN